MWVPGAAWQGAAGARKWASHRRAALKALPAGETLGTTWTLPLPLRCQQTVERGQGGLWGLGVRGAIPVCPGAGCPG